MRLGPETPLREARPGGKRRWLALALVSLLALGWSGLFFGVGFTFRDFVMPSLRSLTGTTSVPEIISSLRRAPRQWLRGQLSEVTPPKLQIDIKFKYLNKLHEKRAEALRARQLVTGDDDFVPAEIRYEEQIVPVRLRLKGDLPDHLEGRKWSFRVKTRGGAAILGMRRFSLQAPNTRGFQAEPLFLESLRWLGVIAPRYFFVEVEINGANIGLMALEEHFDKVLLESQSRRESVILKLDESDYWQNRLLVGHHHPFDRYRHASVEAFGMGGILRSPTLMRDLRTARGLLRGFLEGELIASEVFDETLLGRLLAACEIWNAPHPCRWHNLRFYFNPIDRELEPIGFDGNLQWSWLDSTLIVAQEPISREFLRDPVVRGAFFEAIRELADGLEGGRLLERLRERQEADLEILHREFPARSPLDLETVRRRAVELRDLDPDALFEVSLPRHAQRRYPRIVLANLLQGESGPELQLASALPYPVQVESVHLHRGANAEQGESREALAGFPVDLPASPRDRAPTWRRVPLPLKTPVEALRVSGKARVHGQTRSESFTARPSHPTAHAPEIPHRDSNKLIESHAFLRRSSEANFLEILPGSWSIEEPLILPTETGLRIGPNTQLRFAPDAVLVVRGPTEFNGSANAPIRLEPLQPEQGWPGLVVLNAGSESHWSHVKVVKTNGFSLGDWVLTGAVTFFESDVSLSRCSFRDNHGEDALNIIRSRFRLIDISVQDAASDGFDGDFTRGEIRGGHFSGIGGDGIDVSGSNIAISGTRLEAIRDKAISIGEGSELVATDLLIEGVGIAVASKDDSLGTIRDSTVRNVRHTTFMAYQKKPEFGPGRLNVENVAVESAAQIAVTQWGSRLRIDGVAQPEGDFDAEAAYTSGPMKK